MLGRCGVVVVSCKEGQDLMEVCHCCFVNIQLIKLFFTSTKEVYVFAFVYLSVSKITKNDADEF